MEYTTRISTFDEIAAVVCDRINPAVVGVSDEAVVGGCLMLAYQLIKGEVADDRELKQMVGDVSGFMAAYTASGRAH